MAKIYTLKSEIVDGFQTPPVNNVAQYILEKVESRVKSGNGDLDCIGDTSNNESYKYKDIGPLSQKLATWLRSKGLVKGDIILYSSHDGAKLHISLLGVWQIGGIARSSYPEDHGEELIERIKESHVMWILCDPQNVEVNLVAAAEVPWDVSIIVAGSRNSAPLLPGCYSLLDIFENDVKDFKKPPLDTRNLSEIALILQTSGTSGKSKGTIYTHGRLLQNIVVFQHIPFTENPSEAFLLTSRLTHFTGSVIPFAIIAQHRRVLINSKPSFETILEDITSYKVRGILAFPKFLLNLANDLKTNTHDISSVKCVVTAGQVVGPSFVDAIKTISSVDSLFLIYGMTEIGLISINTDWIALAADDEFPEFSCGKLAPGNQLRVKDVDTGQSVGAMKTGEFYVRSPYSSVGYYKNPKASEETFHNGWVRTGDVGYYDKAGFIFIKDRRKEIFKYFNNHICPSELEDILLQHPNVKEAGVVGVPDPDGGGTIPRAFVVLNNVQDSSESLMQIKKFLDGKVASYKQLRGGMFELKELPIGKSGKVLRSMLQNLQVPPA